MSLARRLYGSKILRNSCQFSPQILWKHPARHRSILPSIKAKPRRMSENLDGLTIGTLNVIPRSVSGLESTIVVRGVKGQKDEHLNVVFDMGCAIRPSVLSQHVFISHGHTDHIAGIASHAAKRSLYRHQAATYYVPKYLEAPLKVISTAFTSLNESNEERGQINTCVVDAESQDIKLPHGYLVRAFPTMHRVPSQGYIVYRTEKCLKPEYSHMQNEQIRELIKQGIDFSYIKQTPLVAYTGDTLVEVFDNLQDSDVLKVKLLITEATYIDDGPNAVSKAREWGHIHLQELVERQHLFSHVDNLFLVHFSDKYSTRYIKHTVDEIVPNDFRKKIILGLSSLNRP